MIMIMISRCDILVMMMMQLSAERAVSRFREPRGFYMIADACAESRFADHAIDDARGRLN